MPDVFSVKTARHGKGLFAAESIRTGQAILIMRGPVISYQQVLRMKKPDNAFQISRNRYINLRKPGVLGNHSCEPNAGVTKDLILVAIKPIKKGQEITYDYSACMDKDTICDFTCDCGTKGCRTIIKGFATLPKARQARYKKLGIIQKFLEKER